MLRQLVDKDVFGTDQLGRLIPLGCWWVCDLQCTACRVPHHYFTGTAIVFLSEL